MSNSPYILGSIKKLPAKYAKILVPLILSGLMSGIISLVTLLHKLGFVDDIISIWFPSWMFAWCVAFPSIMILLPFVKNLVGNHLVVESTEK